MNERLLLAGGDDALLDEVEARLAGHVAIRVHTRDELANHHPDGVATVAVLCLRLADASAGESMRALQVHGVDTPMPILVIGDSDDPIDRIVALELGADDFVARTAPGRELALRVAVLFRRCRPPPAQPPVRETRGRIELDRAQHRVWVDGEEVTLSASEFRLLQALASPAGAVHRRESLEALFADGSARTDGGRWLDARVARLRARLGGGGEQIETVRGAGFRLAPGR